jgi:hypothetical protein
MGTSIMVVRTRSKQRSRTVMLLGALVLHIEGTTLGPDTVLQDARHTTTNTHTTPLDVVNPRRSGLTMGHTTTTPKNTHTLAHESRGRRRTLLGVVNPRRSTGTMAVTLLLESRRGMVGHKKKPLLHIRNHLLHSRT